MSIISYSRLWRFLPVFANKCLFGETSSAAIEIVRKKGKRTPDTHTH